MIETHAHTNQHAHKNKVAPQCLSAHICILIFSSFTICFPLFSSIPLCLVQWRREDGRREARREGKRREGGVCLCACWGCVWKFLRHSGGVVVIQGVIQGDNEKTDKSTLISMWLIPSSAPPSPHPPHFLLLFVSLLLSFPLGLSPPLMVFLFLSISLQSPSLPPSPLPPLPHPCSFKWHSCTEREENLWIIRKWASILISYFTLNTQPSHNWNAANRRINRKRERVERVCECVCFLCGSVHVWACSLLHLHIYVSSRCQDNLICSSGRAGNKAIVQMQWKRRTHAHTHVWL